MNEKKFVTLFWLSWIEVISYNNNFLDEFVDCWLLDCCEGKLADSTTRSADSEDTSADSAGLSADCIERSADCED